MPLAPVPWGDRRFRLGLPCAALLRAALRAGMMAVLAALLLAVALLAACVSEEPAPSRPPAVWVLHVTVEPGVYHITVRWAGPPPPYREALLLERAARLAAQAGARYFAVINATEPVAHPEWLAPQAVYAPLPVVRPSDLPEGAALSALIQVFAGESPPDALRLYDAERILSDRNARNR